ncbi:MAG TPA: hypothetical protein VF070_04910 [Streptosporangiaceae bacterium]
MRVAPSWSGTRGRGSTWTGRGSSKAAPGPGQRGKDRRSRRRLRNGRRAGIPITNAKTRLGVADLVTAAVRADRGMEGQHVLEWALSHLNGTASPRLEPLIARARGILAGPGGAEAHFNTALADPAGDQWPFERAQLRLDYVKWLRRRSPDQRRQARTGRGSGNLPAARCPVLSAMG